MIPYKFLSVTDKCPNRGYWDMAMLEDIFKDPLFTENDGTGAIVVLPGAGQKNEAKAINKELNKLQWVILIVTSDEESQFPIEEIKHPNIRIYVQYPKQPRHDHYGVWPIGYTPHTRENLELVDKDLDWVFAGQITHKRREDMAKQLEAMIDKGSNGMFLPSEGFTEGIEPDQYIKSLCRAKIVPAPSGPISADSFRLYEALEAGAIPIADNKSPAGDRYFWDYLIGYVPFPTINNFKDLPGYVEDVLAKYDTLSLEVQAWYMQYKNELKKILVDEVHELTGEKQTKAITVVIPTSPIKSHPSTEILEKCVDTVKVHLPEADIYITFDGVRKEQADRTDDYNEFKRRALFLCNTKWNAVPVLFKEHTHQVGMLRAIMDDIYTPALLYVEGDTGLTPDLPIDWQYCFNRIIDGSSNLIRFHFESRIPNEHQHMMLGLDGELMRTSQWSQRPHLASTAYYRRILQDYFTPDAKSFIEDKMHSVLFEAVQRDSLLGWNQHRVHIYHPTGHLKRSVNFDGREDEPKWDDTQVF